MSSSINIDFTANLARFTSSIDKATNDLSRFESNTERISSQVNGALRNIGVGLSAAVFVGFTKGIIDSADALLDLSKSTGVAIETLGGFKLAAEQSGVELETVARGIQKFSAAIFAGSEDTEKSLSRLGLSLQELKQQSPEEQFFSLAKALEGVAKEQRPAVVIDLLGQKLAGLVPLLEGGADGLRAMTEEGKKTNKGLTDLAPAADQFNDQLAKLKQTSTGLFATLVRDSLPSLNEYLISMKAIVESGTWLEKLAFFSTGYTSGRIADKANDPVEQVRRYTEEIKKLKGELENINPLLDRSGKKRAKTETQAELAIAEAGLATQEARVRLKNQLAAEKVFAESLSKKISGGDSGGDSGGASSKAKSDADKRTRDRQKIFDDNRKQEEQNSRVEFDIDFSSIEADDDAFRKTRDRIADLKKEFTELIDPVEKYRVKLNEIDEAQQAGALSAEQASEARFKINEAIDAQLKFGEALKENGEITKKFLAQYVEDAGNFDAQISKLLSNGFRAAEDSLVNFARTGKLNFKDFANSIINDLLRIQAQKAISSAISSASDSSGLFGSILSGIANLFIGGGGAGAGAGAGGGGGAVTQRAANGGVFGGQGGLSAYSGSVVSSPTLFKFASGTGLMGEAGPEAILPLKRGSDGKLGVSLSGGGGYVDNRVFKYNIDARGADLGVEERLRRALRESEERAVNRSVSQVQNLNQRGMLRVY